MLKQQGHAAAKIYGANVLPISRFRVVALYLEYRAPVARCCTQIVVVTCVNGNKLANL